MVRRLAPDVVLMDIRMPEMDGIEATRRLKAARPSVGVVALTRHGGAARGPGHAGGRRVRLRLKDSDGDEIVHAIRQAAGGGGVISPEVTPVVIEELDRSPRARTPPGPPAGARPGGAAGAGRAPPAADRPRWATSSEPRSP